MRGRSTKSSPKITSKTCAHAHLGKDSNLTIRDRERIGAKNMTNPRIREMNVFKMLLCAISLMFALVLGAAITPLVIVETAAQEQGQIPGSSLGNQSDADLWRALRNGEAGRVSGPNPQAGVMIQSEGDLWRSMRNGPLATYGIWALIGIIALLALFFLLRGRIQIDGGPSYRTVVRFNAIERCIHWLTASTFVVLALTGLNLLYGKFALLPLLGPDIFAWLTIAGK